MAFTRSRRVLRIMVNGLFLADWQGRVRGILLLWPLALVILLWQRAVPVSLFLMLLGCWWIANGVLNAVSRFDFRGLLASGYLLAGIGFVLMGVATGTDRLWLDVIALLLELSGIGLVAAGSSLRRLFVEDR